MDAIRWVLILIAIGAAAAAALWLGLSAPPASPAAPSEPTTVAALPATRPLAASAASATTRAVARAASATAAPMPASTRPAAPRIGSEGYGPHIDRAVAGDDAVAAWEAVRWLRLCASNETRRNSLETVRNQGVSPEMMTQMMVEADAEARRCQTVTAQHRVMLPELASRAVRAGVAEAASAFAASTFSSDLTAAQRQQVAEAMRRDALVGDGPSLVNAATSNPAWGLSDAERLSFLMAYAELPDPEAKGMAKSLLERGALHLAAPPTPQQMAAAREAAQQILARRPAGGKP
ncbi:hypothetical protein ASC95_12830 [Pelomonas sp. Root1217]|uniref:hypothetical protein n=1 Tax=Pelomonas sp. Root1217 TaxID=1736430 RepID=UPI00070E1FA6|nr:hypothetical protein [Pelomonas sp. Root1217]KQV50268.1 hypothetical protein ASC95_12830 [Pelomonas sp. Root1217]